MVENDLFTEINRQDDSSIVMKVELGDWFSKLPWELVHLMHNAYNEVYKLRKIETIYPPQRKMYRAFQRLAPYDVKVIVLGQDPYFDGQATGLAFATIDKLNPSLAKINENMKQQHPKTPDLNKKLNLEYLEQQGVLLLNTRFAVREGQPLSLNEVYWKEIATRLVKFLNGLNQPIVWMLWGKEAQSYSPLITNLDHLVLTAEHPSFAARENRNWNCNHFVVANHFFIERKIKPINWA